MKPDLFWIPGPWRGRLAVATRPRGGDWLEDELRSWREAGVDLSVSLLEPDEAAQLDLSEEPAAAAANRIGFLSLPIPDRGIPDSWPATASLLHEIADALESGGNVAIHCRQGIGRSGMIAAAVLTHAGVDPNDAIRTVSSARGMQVPETAEQRRWIQALSSRPPVVAR